jgi:hypothetical protein
MGGGLKKNAEIHRDGANQPGETYETILRELEKARWSVPRGFSVMSIREDRDSG